ncbi:hypothetical protein [Histidinibacterium aquaticum]|uniref:Uncharacterized protein n=1 Tax=Histidinibacterium aquaticum TaxID=2613962 RepID=A0A5J5GHW6_9RHOB|nr:hypothetical protein [Histidinibacterium aquaticum]KAA9007114.1 hypothetical protein F3S47_15240 [Histidinibacterium aquaticum]
MRGLLLSLALLPGLASAQGYDGTYRQSANADCGLIGVDGGAVRIEDGIFYGVGMECRMTQPVNIVDMSADLFTLECSGDEGELWTERVMLMDAAEDDGLFMIWDGYAFRYDRCTHPVAEVAED